MDKETKRLAAAEFDSVCAGLDGRGIKYEKHSGDLELGFIADGSDMPVQMVVKVNPELKIVTAMAFLPIEVPENKVKEFALALSMLNADIVHGGFDFDPKTRQMLFRASTSYRGSTVDNKVYDYLIGTAYSTADRTAGLLKGLCDGTNTLKDIAALLEA